MQYTMMTGNRIENGCSGNTGRSTLAELVMRNHFEDLGISDYVIASSGVSVNTPHSSEPRTPSKRIIQLGLEGDVYSPSERKAIENALHAEKAEELLIYHDKAIDTFKAREVAHRDEAIKYFNIRGSIKTVPEQTIVRPELAIFFAMDNKARDAFRIIYAEAQGARVEFLGGYALGDDTTEIPNAFGMSKDFYFNMASDVLKYAKFAADRFIREKKSVE